MAELAFPPGFVWGAATAAYQIEGANEADGRSDSIWDRFCATPGKVRNGDSGAVACDFYRRFPEDIALMRGLGLDSFRFSIAWPRVLPDGTGRVNEAGLDFYDRLVDELLANGIAPCVTLYHWDLPQALEDAGGWPARETAEAFVGYVEAVASRLGDRVSHWVTHNEPWVASWLGYGWGVHAPGRTSDEDAVAAAHHLLLSHGWAVPVLRSLSPGADVGITLNLAHVEPALPTAEHAESARVVDGNLNRWFLDAIFRGEYPDDMPYSPPVQAGDLEAIAVPIDFLGVNYYFRILAEPSSNGGLPPMAYVPGATYTDMGWEVNPDGFHSCLARVARDYAPPAIYVTENGAAFGDVRLHDGSVLRPGARGLPRGTPRSRRARNRRRRADPRLLRLVAARQLRVVPRLREAVRDRLRRLCDAGAGAEVELLLVPRLRGGAAGGTDMVRIGLMLWTVREECAGGAFESTLREVAEMGYEGIELFDLHGHGPGEVASWLADTGLVPCGRHATLDVIESQLPALAAEARTLGWRRLVVSWVDPSELGPDLVVRLTTAAAAAAAHGLELGFHNHDAEVRPRDGGPGFLDELLASDELFLELDLGWAWYAGADPLSLLARARGRCPLVHVKDFHSREPGSFAPVGDGEVGYELVAPAAIAAGAEWLLVEQDETDGPALDAARRSLEALTAMVVEVAV